MRAEELDHDGKAVEPSPESVDASPEAVEMSADATESTEHAMPERAGPASFGQKLRAAREAKGLSRNDIAQRLRLPLRLIARLEDDDYSGIDQGVYLRGYLSSYARMVDIPVVAAETVAAANVHVAPLIATGQISRSRYLFDRYSVSATYVILTALIVVPAVWLATHGGLEQNLARTSLDAPTASISIPPASNVPSDAGSHDTTTELPADATTAAASNDANAPAAVDPPKQEQPVVASMTPFTAPSATPASAETTTAHASVGAHALTLKIKAASWVEIVAADGSKLEYGILPAGAEKTYNSDGPLSVRLGNADGASVDLDGKALDLTPFRHANVARLRVFGPDGAAAQPSEF